MFSFVFVQSINTERCSFPYSRQTASRIIIFPASIRKVPKMSYSKSWCFQIIISSSTTEYSNCLNIHKKIKLASRDIKKKRSDGKRSKWASIFEKKHFKAFLEPYSAVGFSSPGRSFRMKSGAIWRTEIHCLEIGSRKNFVSFGQLSGNSHAVGLIWSVFI